MSINKLQQHALDNISEAVFLLNKDAQICYANETASKQLGYTKDELIEMSIFDIYTSLSQVHEYFKKPQTAKNISIESEYKTKEGAIVPVEISTSFFYEDSTLYYQISAKEITDKNSKQRTAQLENSLYNLRIQRQKLQLSQRELQEAQSKLASIFSTIPDIVWLKDSYGFYLACNSAFERFCGKSESEIVGKTDYDFFSEEGADLCKRSDMDALTSNTVTVSKEEFIYPEDGTTGLLEVRKTPIYKPDGELLGVLGIGRDITKNTQAKQKLQESIEFTQGIINAIPDILFELNRDGKYLNVWSQNEAVLAAQKEHLIGKTVNEVLAPEAAKIAMESIQEADRDGFAFGKTLNINGGWFEHSISKIPGDNNRFLALSRDVTKRKNEEDALLESKNKFSSFFMNSPVSLAINDVETHTYLDVNHKFISETGYEYDEVVGKNIIIWHNESEKKEFFKLLKQNGSVKEFEFCYKRKDGSISYASVTASLTTIDNVTCVISQSYDISEKKNREELLIETQTKLASIFSTIPDIIWLKDSYGHYISCNQAFERYFDKEESEVVGRTDYDFFTEERSDLCKKSDMETLSSNTLTIYKEELTNPNTGTKDILEIRKTPIYVEGKLLGVLGIGRDITKNQQQKELLLKKEQEFRSLSENSPDVIIRYDRDLKRLYVNPTYELVNGATRDEAVGKRPFDKSWAISGIVSTYEEFLKKVLQTGEPDSTEFSFKDKNNKTIHYSQSAVPEFDSDQNIISVLTVARDITKSKEDEEDLKRIKAKLSAVISTIPDLVWVKDEDGVYLMCNPSFERFFGASKEEIIGKTDYDFLSKEQADFFRQKDKEAMEAGEICINEEKIVFADNSQHAVLETRKIPVYNDENFMGVLGIGRDITERKRMEDELRESEKHLKEKNDMLQSIMDNSVDVIYLVDVTPEGRFIHKEINKAYTEKTGMTREEILGNYVDELKDESFREILLEKYSSCLNEGARIEYINEYNFPTEVKIFHSTLSPIFDEEGRICQIAGVARDITQSKRQEELLRKKEQEFRTLAQNIPDPIFRYDREGRRIYVNAAVERISGISADVLLGKDATDAKLVSTDDALKVVECIKKVLSTKKSVAQEFIHKAADGQEFIFKNTHIPEFGADGEVESILSVAHDITAFKRQQELLEALAKIEKRQSQYFAMAPGLFVTVLKDADGNYSLPFVSEGIRDVYGIEPKTAIEDISTFVSVAHPDDIEMTFIKAEESARDLTPYHIEYRINHPHKGIRWIECNSMPQLMPDGSIRWDGFYHDVTERKEMEELLRQKEQEFRSLAENIPDNIARWDTKGRYLYINTMHQHLLGMTLAEAIGTTIPDTHTAVKETVAQVISTGETVTTLQQIPNENGNIAIHHVAISPEFDENGEIISILGIGRDITETYRMQEELSVREREFRALAEHTHDTIARYDKECVRLYTNPAFAEAAGVEQKELIGKKPTDYYDSEQAKRYEEAILHVFQSGEDSEVEYSWPDKNGSFITSHVMIVPEKDEDGIIHSVLATGRDITKLKKYETELKENEKRLREAQQIAKVGSWELEFPELKLTWSKEIYNIFELDPDEEKPSYDHFLNSIHPEDHKMVDAVYAESIKDKASYDVVHRLLLKNGRVKYVHERGQTFYDSKGDIIRSVGTVQDITEQKTIEKRIEHMAHHDILTGLPNRLLTKDRVNHSIEFSKRDGKKTAIIFLDLDGFKTINDSMGHSIGDEVLKVIAMRIKNVIRECDTISRQGGDEFLIVLSEINEVQDVIIVLEKLLYKFEKPFDINGYSLSTSASIGVALYPEHGDSFEALLQNADAAMYKAKENGKNTYCFYTQEMNQNIARAFQIQNDLKKALINDELVLHYQPQINLTNNSIIGAEALIRWNHPKLGMIPPMDFISVAEESGLIVQIGEWVLTQACAQAALWHEEGIDITVAANISAVQFKRGNLVEVILNALDYSGLDARFLELELTESIMINDVESVLNTVRQLKEIGVQLSIDDFGTGYSSLAYLKRFAVDKLKIDQSFIRNIIGKNEDSMIVRTIVEMAKNLHLKTIAEGVETEDILDIVHSLGCDEVQGYHFAKPMEIQEFNNYILDFKNNP